MGFSEPLRLSTETIRVLTSEELEGVAGGVRPLPTETLLCLTGVNCPPPPSGNC